MKKAAELQVHQDWHPADIKAALDKAGYSFARIARENGYRLNSPNVVLHRAWSQVEQLVAKILGVQASEIWPSRYDRRGRPLKSRTARVKQSRTISKRGTVSNV
uniref:Putative transcriptional regulator, Nlp n=1 Tax=Geobacter sp. (strain M21) TaxID=443144 RepID=C6E6U5_GEOSM